jgi:diguanylate cyclase (GGDEF)-like protein
VHDFLDPSRSRGHSAEILAEDAFRRWLARETDRATRYQDFFTVCLVRPDLPEGAACDDSLQGDLTRKIAEMLRSTDVVGRFACGGTAVLLLHTPSATPVAERLCATVERIAFAVRAGRPTRVTLSVGEASFPRDGHNYRALLDRAQACSSEAARRGGNRVIRAEDLVA